MNEQTSAAPVESTVDRVLTRSRASVMRLVRGASVGAAMIASAMASPLVADEVEPPTVQRTTVGNVEVEIRIGGGLRAMPPEFANLAFRGGPRLLRGSMLPSNAQLLATEVDPRVRAAITELGDESWSVRQGAARALLDMSVGDEQMLAALVQAAARGELSAEQWHRLLDIACQRLREAPRGAMGIRMERRVDGFPGVLVSDLLPGLPAEQLLRIGDRIIEIDGRPVADSEELIESVQLRRPGDAIRLRVLRPRRDENGREQVGPQGQIAFDELGFAMDLGNAEHLDRFGDIPAGDGLSSVSRLRIEQAAEARARFGMPVATVPIAGPRTITEVAMMPDPDDHEALVNLRVYRQLLDEGVITATPAMRRAWRQTLEMLNAQADAPELSEAIRAHLREVARRYAELIPNP